MHFLSKLFCICLLKIQKYVELDNIQLICVKIIIFLYLLLDWAKDWFLSPISFQYADSFPSISILCIHVRISLHQKARICRNISICIYTCQISFQCNIIQQQKAVSTELFFYFYRFRERLNLKFPERSCQNIYQIYSCQNHSPKGLFRDDWIWTDFEM